MKRKIFIISIISLLFLTVGCNKTTKKEDGKNIKQDQQEEKVNIVNLESNTRPYAVVINNFPYAVEVQAGLDKAYIVYEFPIEGGISRSLALFKDVSDAKIGTIRSARQNYLDYALENDAILIHFGGNFKANEDLPKLNIDHVDGNIESPFYRENPIGLATEHTAYTNLGEVIDYTTNKKQYRTTTEVLPPLKYSAKNVDLSKYEGAMSANTVIVPYSYSYEVKYVYNNDTNRYDRYVNDSLHKDYFNGNNFDTKNIIIVNVNCGQLTGHTDAAGSNYLNIDNIGSGSGYYITNGYAIPITWQKNSREEQTKYLYNDEEIKINDGNTFIMFQNTSLNSVIE